MSETPILQHVKKELRHHPETHSLSIGFDAGGACSHRQRSSSPTACTAILSVLLGLPHVLLDNSYGKVRAYYETWSQSLPLAHWAANPEEAFTMAETLRDRVR